MDQIKDKTIDQIKGKAADIQIQTCIKGERPAFSVIQKDYIPFTVYDRSKLFPKAVIPGPAIIEERESTIVIGEDASAQVDKFGFIWIKLTKSGVKNDR